MFTCFFHFSQSHPTQTRNTHWHIRKMLCECDDSRMMTNELTRRANAQTTRIQVQNWKNIMLVILLEYTAVMQSILCLTVLTIQQWNYSEKYLKKKTTTRKQFVVYASDTPVTLKQGLGHKTWYKLADPKVIILQILKNLAWAWRVSVKEPTIKNCPQIRIYINYLPWICQQ